MQIGESEHLLIPHGQGVNGGCRQHHFRALRRGPNGTLAQSNPWLMGPRGGGAKNQILEFQWPLRGPWLRSSIACHTAPEQNPPGDNRKQGTDPNSGSVGIQFLASAAPPAHDPIRSRGRESGMAHASWCELCWTLIIRGIPLTKYDNHCIRSYQWQCALQA